MSRRVVCQRRIHVKPGAISRLLLTAHARVEREALVQEAPGLFQVSRRERLENPAPRRQVDDGGIEDGVVEAAQLEEDPVDVARASLKSSTAWSSRCRNLSPRRWRADAALSSGESSATRGARGVGQEQGGAGIEVHAVAAHVAADRDAELLGQRDRHLGG